MEAETLGKTIINDRYEVRKVLGRGGMGQVYLVTDLLGQPVSDDGAADPASRVARELALKCIPVGSRFSEFVDYFKHEFRTLAKLRHPNIAEVYDFGLIEETGEYFFTSEWVDGIDLFTATEQLCWDDLVVAIVQTCRGLEYIHSRGIVHYDIKPTNILYRAGAEGGLPDERGLEVKLIDFGLAEERRPGAEVLDVIKGTVSYIAPEVAKSVAIDKRADLYSLGVTLFQCATRQLPFTGASNLEVIRQHIHARPRRPRDLRPDLPIALETVILKLLEKDPASRYSSANEVIRAVNRLMSRRFQVETKQTTESYIYTGRFVGREADFERLQGAFTAVFGAAVAPAAEEDSEPLLTLESDDGEDDAKSGDETIAVKRARDDEEPAAEEPVPPDTAPGPDAPPARLILIAGESGIGKTRLLREFKNHVQLSAVELFEGTCTRDARAYQPFVQILRRLLGARRAEARRSTPASDSSSGAAGRRDALELLIERFGAEVAKLVPEVIDRALAPSSAMLDPEADRLRLLDGVSRFLVELSCARPMVLYLQDLHWADEATVDLLVFLARQLRQAAEQEPKLLVVANYRSSEAEAAPLGRSLERLGAEVPCCQLHLRPLGPDDVSRLIASMLGVSADDGDGRGGALDLDLLARRIFEETKGNPFFIEEVMKSLLERGLLRVVDGRWRTSNDDVRSLTLPGSVKDVIAERVRRLGAREVDVLTWVSAIRRAVTIDELERMADLPRGEVFEQLERLERKQILHKSSRGGQAAFELAHDLMGEAIYEQIAPGRAREMHLRIAETLERLVRAGEAAEDPGELADHFERAGEATRALDYCVRAGEANRALHANPEAIRYYEKALSLLERIAGERHRRFVIAERLADVYELIGDYDRAIDIYRDFLRSEAIELSAAERARVNRKIGAIHERRGEYDEAIDAYRSSIATVAGSEEDAKLRAATASVLLKTADMPDSDRYREALRWAESARDIVAAYPETVEVAPIYEILGLAHARKGDYKAAAANFQKSLDIHGRAGSRAGIAWSLRQLGALEADRGDLRAAVERYDRALAISEAIGHVQGVAETASLLGDVHHALGNYKTARQYLGKALGIRKRIGDREGVVRSLNRLGLLFHDLGQHELAIRQLEESRRLCAGMEDRDELANALTALGRIYTTVGAFDLAEPCASEALGEAMLLDPRGPEDVRSATALKAQCYYTLGALRAAQGETDQAEPYLLRALTVFERVGARYEAAKVKIEIAELLAADDAERAAEVIGSVEPLVEELRLSKLQVALRLARGRIRAELDPGAALDDLAAAREGAVHHDKPEVVWRAAYETARAYERLGTLERAATVCVEALEILKRLHEQLPAELREGYLRDPRRQAVRETFRRLKEKLVG